MAPKKPRERRVPLKRNVQLRLRLAEDVLQRAEVLAGQWGLPTATLCSVAIGEFITRHERAGQALQQVTQAVAKDAGEQLRLFAKLVANDELKDAEPEK